jgi:hypothetical protein
VGIVVAKRKGNARPEDQWAIMTQGDLLKLLLAAQNTPSTPPAT